MANISESSSKTKVTMEAAAKAIQDLQARQAGLAQSSAAVKSIQADIANIQANVKTGLLSSAQAAGMLKDKQTVLASAMANYKSQAAGVAQASANLKSKQVEMSDSSNKGSEALKKFGSAAVTVIGATGKIAGMAKQVGDAILKAGKAALEAAGHIAKLGLEAAKTAVEGLGKLAGAAEKAGANLAKGLAIGGAALTGIATVGAKAAGDLEQQVANISTIAPDIDTKKVFNSLNMMQTEVKQTAAQLGDSLYNVYSSIKVDSLDQALNAVKQFSKGAVAAGTDADTFGTAIMGVLNAYKMNLDDVNHVQDVFFNTVAAGVVKPDELAASLGPVTQSAKAAGVSLDELGGMIAGVTKEGGPAAQNINNLNNLFAKFTTKEAQSAINELGVKTQTAAGDFRPMTDVMGDLKVKLQAMTPAAQALALQKIFPDLQARQGAQTIMSQLDFVKASINDNVNAVGVAEGAYTKMADTFNTSMAMLGNTAKAAMTTIGKNLLPVLTPLAKDLAAGIKGALPQIDAVSKIIADKLGAGITTVRENIATFGASFREGFNPPPGLKEFPDLFSKIGAATRVGLQTAKDSITTFKGALSGNWVDNGGIQTFTRVIGELGTIVRRDLQIVKDNIITFKAALAGNWVSADGIQPVTRAIGEFALKLGQVMPVIVAVWQAFSPLNIALTLLQGYLSGGVVGALDAFGGKVRQVGQILGVDLGGVVAMVGQTLAGVGQVLGTLGSAFARIVPEAFKLIGAISAIIANSGVLPAIFGAISGIINTVADAFNTVSQAIRANAAGIQAVMTTVGSVITNIGQLIQNVITFIAGVIANNMATIVSIGQNIGNIIGNVVKILGNVFEALKPTIATVVTFFLQLADVVGGALVNAFGIIGPIIEKVAGLLGSVITGAVNIAVGGINLFIKMINGLIDIANNLPGPLQQHITKLKEIDMSSAAAAGSTKTFGSSLIGLTANMAQLGTFAKDAGSGFGAIAGKVQTTTSALGGMNGATGQYNIYVSEAAAKTKSLTDAVDQLQGRMNAAQQAMNQNQSMMQALDSVVAGMPGNIQAMWTQWKEYSTAVFEGKDANGQMAAKVGELKAQMSSFSPEMAKVVQGYENQRDQLYQNSVAYKQNAIDAALASQSLQNNNAAVKSAGDAYKGSQQQLREFRQEAQLVGSSTTQSFVQVKTGAETAFNGLQTSARGGLNNLKNEIQSTTQSLPAVLSDAGADMQSSFSTQLSGLATDANAKMADVKSTIQSNLQQNAQTVQQSGVDMKAAMDASMTQMQTSATAQITALKTSMEAGLAELAPMTMQAGTAMLQALVTTLGQLPGAVSGPMDTMVATVSGYAGTLMAAGAYVGDNLVAGLMQALEAGKSRVAAAAADMMNQIQAASAAAMAIHSPSGVMRDQIGANIMLGLAEGIKQASGAPLKETEEAVTSIANIVGQGSEAFQKLKDYGGVNLDIAQQFSDDMGAVLTIVSKVAATFKADALKQVTEFANTLKSIVDVIAGGVEATKKLNEYSAMNMDVMNQFVADMSSLMRVFVPSAIIFKDEAIKATQEYANALKAVLDIIASAVDGMKKLSEYQAMNHTAMNQFAVDMFHMTEVFAAFGIRFTAKGLEGAKNFAEALKGIIDIIGPGVEAIKVLNNYQAMSDIAMNQFVYDMTNLALVFTQKSALFNQKGLEGAKNYAETLKSIIDVIGPGVEAVAKLNTYVAMLDDHMNQFIYDATNLALVFGSYATQFNQKSLEASKAYAESLKSVVEVIGPGVEAIKALNTYKAIMGNQLQLFATDMFRIMSTFSVLGAKFTAEALKAATDFASAAKVVVEVIGPGVQGFTELSKYKGVASSAIAAFSNDIFLVVQAFSAAAVQFKAEALVATGNYADAAKKVVDTIGPAVQGFLELQNFSGVPEAALNSLMVGVERAIQLMSVLASRMNSEMVSKTAEFGDAVGKVMGGLKNAVDLFKSLAEGFKPAKDAVAISLDSVLAITQYVMNTIGAMASKLSTEGMEKTAAFGDSVNKVFGGLKNALDVFKELADLKADPAKQIGVLVNGVAAGIATMDNLRVAMGPEMMVKVTAFATAANAVFDKLKAAMDFFKTAEEFKDNPANALKAVLAGLESALGVMNDNVGKAQALLDAATKFADTAKAAAAKASEGAAAAAQASSTTGSSTGGAPAIPVEPIPQFASGVTNFHGGLAIVGEKGPELVHMPQGASVFTAGETASIIGQAQNVASTASKEVVEQTNAYTEMISKIFGTIKEGADAIASLASYQAMNVQATNQFVQDAQMIASAFMNVGHDYSKEMLEAIGSYLDSVGKVLSNVKTGTDAFLGLKEYSSIGLNVIQAFSDDVLNTVRIFMRGMLEFDVQSIAASSTFADTIGKILGVVSTGITTLNQLQGYGSIGKSSLYAFSYDLVSLASIFSESAASVKQQTVQASLELAASFGKLFDNLKPAIEGLNSLRDYSRIWTGHLYQFIGNVVEFAGLFSYLTELVDKKTVDDSAKLAESFSKITNFIKGAAEGLNSIRDYGRIATSHLYQFIGNVTEFAGLFAFINDTVDQGVMKHAAELAESFGKITAIIKSGVENLTALKDFTRIAQAPMLQFITSITDFSGLFASATKDMDIKAIESASAVAESMSKIVGIIKGAVENFAALKDYGKISRQTVAIFLQDLKYFTEAFVETAPSIAEAVLKRATDYAEITGKVVGIIKSAIENLASLKDYSKLSRSTVGVFLDDLKYFATAFISTAPSVAKEILDNAGNYAESVGKFTGIMKNATEGLASLSTYTSVPSNIIDIFVQDLVRVMNRIITATQAMNTDGIKVAGDFGEATSKVFGGIKSALDTFKEAKDYGGIFQNTMETLIRDTKAAFQFFANEFSTIDAATVGSANTFADAVSKTFGAIKTAIDTFGAIKDFRPSDIIDNLIVNLVASISKMSQANQVAQTFYGLSQQFSNYLLMSGQAFSSGLNSVKGSIGPVADSLDLNKIPGFSGGAIAPNGIYNTPPNTPTGGTLAGGTTIQWSGNIILQIEGSNIQDPEDLKRIARDLVREMTDELGRLRSVNQTIVR
jgi:phage-related protein